MKKWLVIIFIAVLLFISGCETAKIVENNEKILEQNKVIRVIDGDTFVLATGEHVRMLHINTPEKGEHCYQEAKTMLAELVLNKKIWLERDMQSTDKYNRSLRYVYLGNESMESVNEMMVESGFAVTYVLLPNTKYKNAFFEAEGQAIENKAGCLWQNQSEFLNCIKVVEIAKCPDDYVVLANVCGDINLSGWTMQDESRSRYSFSGIIERDSAIKIMHGGWETTHECIWSDYSNTLYMFDSNNQLVLRYHY